MYLHEPRFPKTTVDWGPVIQLRCLNVRVNRKIVSHLMTCSGKRGNKFKNVSGVGGTPHVHGKPVVVGCSFR